MSIPELTHQAGIFNFLWRAEAVSFRIDRLREDSRDNLFGEVVVRDLTSPTTPMHLHGPAKLNITSTAGQRTLASLLTDRLPDTDWYALVIQACNIVARVWRDGEPAIRLHEVEPRTESRFRLEPLIVDGFPTLLYGPGGAGKSMLALYLLHLVALPQAENNLKPNHGNGLYLDYEFSKEETKERALAMFDKIASPVFYRFCYQPFPGEIEVIQRIVMENSIRFIVIDSAGPACGGEPNESSRTIPVFNAIRTLGSKVATLIIAHVSKEEMKKRNKDTAFGSIYWWNLSRNAFELRRTSEPNEDLEVVLVHRKSNTFGRYLDPMGFRFRSTGPTGIQVEALKEKEDASLEQATWLSKRIRDVLTKGKMTVEDMADELGEEPDVVGATLRRYKGRLWMVVAQQDKKNAWGLIEKNHARI